MKLYSIIGAACMLAILIAAVIGSIIERRTERRRLERYREVFGKGVDRK